MQGPSLKSPLVLGKHKAGLYFCHSNSSATKGVVLSVTTKPDFDSSVFFTNSSCNSVSKNISLSVWHNRLGHLPLYKLKTLNLCNKESVSVDFDHSCEICSKARQHKLPFGHSTIQTSSTFQLIHIDLWGPYHTKTYTNQSYFLTIVDDFSRSTWTHLLSVKSNAFDVIKGFIQMVERQFNKQIQIIRSDNAFELGSSNEAIKFFQDKGIIHQTSCVYSPQQNGVVERKHKHLLETSRALLFMSRLPLKFWGDCVLTATYLINRFPSKVLDNKSPYTVLYNKPPSFDHIKSFGCLCYASTLQHNRDKFQPRSIPCIFIGYPYGKKAYKLFNIEDQKVIISRDVVFHENIFPYSLQNSHSIPDQIFPTSSNLHHEDSDPISTPIPPPSPTPIQNHPSSQQNLRRSTRSINPPVRLKDYVCPKPKSSNFQPSNPPCASFASCMHTMTQIASPGHVCFTSLSDNSKNLITNLSQIHEPSTYEEAASIPEWQEAMQKEFDALEANNTWVIVDLPKGKKPISCKWVYKVKYKANGDVERCKGRLVVKGFTQKAGIDYTETFSPVVKMTTIRSLIATAVKKKWPLFQLDVNNAFLHGDLDEEIYMKAPPGLQLSNPNQVCLLKKSLYGLKQASRQWYAKLSSALKDKGFVHSKNDYSLFHKKVGSNVTYVAVYVDDIMVTGNDQVEIDSLKSFLDSTFKIKDLGLLNYFLGIEVLYTTKGVVLTQKKFANDMLKEFNIQGTALCPLPINLKLSLGQGAILENPELYRKIVGKLNFLVHTRPDLAFCVQFLSQFMSDPRLPHYEAAIHVLHYLNKDPNQGLFMNDVEDFGLRAYCDSDWAACPNSRRSVSGFVILLGNSPISWKSKKQVTVSLSSAEAEYRSMQRVTSELAWLTRLLHELSVPNVTPVPIKCDSQSAIHIAKNPVFHERTKHVEIDCHFVREKLQDGLISLQHVPTQSQLADLFTKSLPSRQHYTLLHKLGVLSPSNLRGVIVYKPLDSYHVFYT